MELNKAIDLFSIEDIMAEDEQSLRKRYRKLMIKYHPDNYGSDEKAKDIQIAYDILKDTLKQLKQYELMNKKDELHTTTIVIPLSKLINIYEGKTIQVGKGESALSIDNGAMRKCNTLLILEATITHNGLTKEFNSVTKWKIEDTYDIYCDIYVTDLSKQEEVTIKIENVERNIKISSQSVKLKVVLPFNIIVNVIITKKINVET